eukprot:TRINITY_DN27503_c0_g1_i1.p1 TRINITY_DN27503_c0_g1~~TRINITY_DN27503_c0_g1_i1.p1  ORF type:complete len:537 (+),score=106.40 TRINITY_DN27503_c0_g1_i1:30-1640(+)
MERLPLGLRRRGRSSRSRSPSDVNQSVPEIIIDSASSNRSSSVRSITSHSPQKVMADIGSKADLIILIRQQFEKASSRDTYQSAASTMGNLIIAFSEEGDPSFCRQLFNETIEMTKQTTGSWGIRFSCWTVTMLVEYFPSLSAISFPLLASACFPALLKASEREDDIIHVAEFIKNVLPLISDVLRGDCDEGSDPDDLLIEGMRYFYYLLSPMVANLTVNGVNQRWASIGLSAVLQSSREPLLSTSGSIYGPCNGEADEVLIPFFGIISSLFQSLDAKVFSEAQPAFLQLFESAIDAALTLSSLHPSLFSVADLIPLRFEEVIKILVRLLRHQNWKVRLQSVDIFSTLTKGMRWQPLPSREGINDVVVILKDLSKTDRIRSVRQRCRSVIEEGEVQTEVCKSCGATFPPTDPFCGQCGASSGQPALTTFEQLQKLALNKSGTPPPPHFEMLYSKLSPTERKKLLLEVARRICWDDDPTGGGSESYFHQMLHHVSTCPLNKSQISLLLNVLESRSGPTTPAIRQLLLTLRDNQPPHP